MPIKRTLTSRKERERMRCVTRERRNNRKNECKPCDDGQLQFVHFDSVIEIEEPFGVTIKTEELDETYENNAVKEHNDDNRRTENSTVMKMESSVAVEEVVLAPEEAENAACHYPKKEAGAGEHVSSTPEITDVISKGCQCSEELTSLLSNKRRTGFRCTSCKLYFSTKSEYEHHVYDHETKKPFCCQFCNKSFSHETYLGMHVKSHQRRIPSKSSGKICGGSITSTTNPEQHKTHHSIKHKKCRTCGVVMGSYEELRDHQALNNCVKTFACRGCGLSFARMYNFQQHERACPSRMSLASVPPSLDTCRPPNTCSPKESSSLPHAKVFRTYSRRQNVAASPDVALKQQFACNEDLYILSN